MEFQFADRIELSARELANAIDRLRTQDALTLPLIPETTCQDLITACDALTYRDARPVVGKNGQTVLQDFILCYDIPAENPLVEFAKVFSDLTIKALGQLDPCPYDGAFSYNDLILQRYPPGSQGISPHRDHLRYECLVALVILAGDGKFQVCRDRSGANAQEVPSPPGCLLLMRAPGLHGRRDRPFHLLTDISQERYSFGLRYDVRAGQEPVFRA